MKTLYLDCGMGAAGDMLTAALLELVPNREAFLEKLSKLAIPGVEYRAVSAEKCGIQGTRMEVLVNGVEEGEGCEHHHHEHHHNEHDQEHHHHHEHNHDHHHGHEHHHHSSLHDIEHIVRDHLDISPRVKDDIMAVYGLIAEAESKAHGMPVDQIHFHEVGTMDAVADITAVCLLMEELGAEKIVASPVHVGSGSVHCAHGILPVPAPATAHILKDVPIYGGEITGELCTPTGAALLKHFAASFGPMPAMKVEAIGYGMGKKDFPRANCVRAMLGRDDTGCGKDEIAELRCNIDDMTGEELGYALNALMEAGAKDVFTTPITMKKNRPAVLLTVICAAEDQGRMASLIFRHTTTLGIRKTLCERYVLSRKEEVVSTTLGEIRVKKSSGYGVERLKAEYCDLADAAEKAGISVLEAERIVAREIK